MSDIGPQQKSTLRPILITVLPLLGCVALAWICAKFSGINFGFLFLLFTGIGALAFMRTTPVEVKQKKKKEKKGAKTIIREETEEERAKRYYLGEEENAVPIHTAETKTKELVDTLTPKSIVTKGSVKTNQTDKDVDDIPDGSLKVTSAPEREEKKLNPDRDLAIRPDKN